MSRNDDILKEFGRDMDAEYEALDPARTYVNEQYGDEERRTSHPNNEEWSNWAKTAAWEYFHNRASEDSAPPAAVRASFDEVIAWVMWFKQQLAASDGRAFDFRFEVFCRLMDDLARATATEEKESFPKEKGLKMVACEKTLQDWLSVFTEARKRM